MYFAGRGCESAAADLASQTLDRAAEKAAQLAQSQDRNPGPYVFQVANYILLEHRRRPRTRELSDDIAMSSAKSGDDNEYLHCCIKCLNQLLVEDRTLLKDYYVGERKGEAKEIRKGLAVELGVASGALRIKLFRLKQKLYGCMSECRRSAKSTDVTR